ncbi:hypothetical protein QQ045_021423 [Rhodiola kirilowii]
MADFVLRTSISFSVGISRGFMGIEMISCLLVTRKWPNLIMPRTPQNLSK